MKTKPILVYDISVCPMSAGITLETVIKIYQEHDIVFYDSTENSNGKEPKILNVDKDSNTVMMDVSEEEGKQKLKEFRL